MPHVSELAAALYEGVVAGKSSPAVLDSDGTRGSLPNCSPPLCVVLGDPTLTCDILTPLRLTVP